MCKAQAQNTVFHSNSIMSTYSCSYGIIIIRSHFEFSQSPHVLRMVSERVKIGWHGSVAGGRGQQKEVYVHSFRFLTFIDVFMYVYMLG